MKNIDIDLFDYQVDLWHKLKTRYRLHLKGRQIGSTYGLMQMLGMLQLQNTFKQVLWIDVTEKKFRQYINRYLLRDFMYRYDIDKNEYHYNQIDKCFYIKDTLIDFGSIEKPDTIDGNAYDLIIQNEVGIQHKKPFIFQEKVMPSLLANPNSIYIGSGVPKGGGGLYEQQYKKAIDPNNKLWSFIKTSTWDRPDYTDKQVQEVANEIPANLRKQEIDGDFITNSDSVFNSKWFKFHNQYNKQAKRYMYIDLAISQKQSADSCSISILEKRGDNYYYIFSQDFKATFNKQLDHYIAIANKYNVDRIGVESNGFQLAVVQELIRKTQYNVLAIPSKQNKIDRANNLALRMEQGYIFLNDTITSKEIEQLESFPLVAHDDTIDSKTGAFNMFNPLNEKKSASAIIF